MAHTRVAAPSSCLPAHTHHCGRQTLPTPFTHTTPARAQTSIVHTQHPIHKSQGTHTHTHTHTHTRGGGSKMKSSREVGRVGIIKELDANGAQDRSQPYQTQARGMLFVSRKYKSTTLLISLSLSLSLVV